MKKKLLTTLLMSFLMNAAFAASFTPYVEDEEEGSTSGFGFLQNWRDPETGEEYKYYPSGWNKRGDAEFVECTTCAVYAEDEYYDCIQQIYDQGVVPVYKDGKVDYYEFPGCPDSNCPLHHVGGWAADADGNISSIHGADEKDPSVPPQLPIGEPIVMLLFAGVYAVVRRKKQK